MSNNQLLDILTREGVLISVSVRYWRAAKKLKPADLGLDADDVTEDLISLGHKRLVPKGALRAFGLIESRAHAVIDQNTFPFMNVGHFLPNSKLGQVSDELERLEQEFNAATEAFIADYGDLRNDALREWRRAAGRLVADPEQLVASISNAFPPVSDMRRRFGFNVNLFQISLPQDMQTDLVTLADQQEIALARSRAAQQAELQIQHGVQGFVQDAVAALREQTAVLCREMLESMGTGKTGCHQKTLNRLVGFIEQFKQLNFANDREMEEQLEQVRREFLNRTAEEYRDDAHAKRQLEQGLRNLADKAHEMARQDTTEIVSRFAALGRRKFNLAA